MAITGAGGFAGGWLKKYSQECGDKVYELPHGLDVLDRGKISEYLTSLDLDVIYHLAALSHVGSSWEDPVPTYQVNVVGTQNVIEAAANSKRKPKVLVVSSSEVYGRVDERRLPITEETPIRPVTPYAASKVAAEALATQGYFGRGISTLVARSFNHVGPSQSENFVVSGLAKRIVMSRLNGTHEVRVGNLTAKRDFTDVRDVVRAYRMLIESGEAGEAYNICSGFSRSISSVAEELIELSGGKVELIVDQSLVRDIEISEVRGSFEKLKAATGWEPIVPFSNTLKETLEYWEDYLGIP